MTLKRKNNHVVWLKRYKLCCQTKFLQDFLIIKKMVTVNPSFKKKISWIKKRNFLVNSIEAREENILAFSKSNSLKSLCLFSKYSKVLKQNLKVGLSPSKQSCVICFIEIPLKNKKNDFYFISKALFAFCG